MKITGPCLGIRQLRCSSWEHKCSLVFRQLLLLCTLSGLLHPVRNNNSELWLTSKAKISLEDFLQLAQRTAGKATPPYVCCFKTIRAMQYRLIYIVFLFVCLFLVGNSNLFHCLKFGLYFWCGSTFLYAINTGSVASAKPRWDFCAEEKWCRQDTLLLPPHLTSNQAKPFLKTFAFSQAQNFTQEFNSKVRTRNS